MVVAPTPGSAQRASVSRQPDASPLSTAELNRELRLRLDRGAAAAARADAAVVGVEHEYSLWRGDTFLDFREFAPRLGRFGEPWHPTEPLVFRSSDGVQLQADANVAEAATPPIPIGPGFAEQTAAVSALGRARLTEVVPSDSKLHGESTHLSIASDPATVRELALRYAQAFAPALMLLIDREDSPGLLVRPRPGRLELCAEHVCDDRLAAVIAFAVGSVRALETAGAPPLPYIEVTIEAARGRFGWFLANDAFAEGMYEQPRSAELRTIDGTSISGQQHIEAAWQVVRRYVEEDASPATLQLIDAMVEGRAPLGVERDDDAGCSCATAAAADAPPGDASLLPEARLHRRLRPGYELCVEAATWDFVAFRAHDAGRSVVANVPRIRLRAFLDSVDAGAIDELVCEALDAAGTFGPLRQSAETARAGFFDAIVRSSELLPRDVMGVGPLTLHPVPTAGRVLADLPRLEVDHAGVEVPHAEPAQATTGTSSTSAGGSATAIAAPTSDPPGTQRERRRPKGTVPPVIGELPATGDPWWRRWLLPGVAALVVVVATLIGTQALGGGDDGTSIGGDTGTAQTSSPTQPAGVAGTEAPVQPTDPPVQATDPPATGGGDLVAAFSADPGSFMSTTFQGSFGPDGRGLSQDAPSWASDVSALAVRGPNGQIYVKFELPSELLGRICGELDLKDGNASVDGDIDWCASNASAPFYFTNVQPVDPGTATGLANLVLCTGITDTSDLIVRAWLLLVDDDGGYEAMEFAIRASNVPDAPDGVTFPDTPAGLPHAVLSN